MGDWFWIHHRKILAAAAAAVVAVVFLFGGCGGEPDAEMAGTVTAGGKKVTWGTVTVVASDNQVYTAPIRPDGTYKFDRLPPGPVRGMSVTSPNPHDHVGQNPALVGRNPAVLPPGVKPSRVPAGGGGAGAGVKVVKGGGRSGTTVGGGRSDKRQAFGMDAPLPPPSITTPANAPPQAQWVPVPGKYGDPLTSGLTPPAAQGPTQFDITLD
jgi:hypothetical protein